jgi:hypothetical protein
MRENKHPKVYIALDKAEVDELEKNATWEMSQVGMGNSNNKCIRNQTIIEIVQWIRDHDIYTRPFSDERTKKEDKIF